MAKYTKLERAKRRCAVMSRKADEAWHRWRRAEAAALDARERHIWAQDDAVRAEIAYERLRDEEES